MVRAGFAVSSMRSRISSEPSLVSCSREAGYLECTTVGELILDAVSSAEAIADGVEEVSGGGVTALVRGQALCLRIDIVDRTA